MKRDIKSFQRNVTEILVHVVGATVNGGVLTTNGLSRGKNQVKVTENGNGDYTLTLNTPGSRACMALATAITAGTYCEIAACAANTVQVLQKDPSTKGAVADADFYCTIYVFDSADET